MLPQPTPTLLGPLRVLGVHPSIWHGRPVSRVVREAIARPLGNLRASTSASKFKSNPPPPPGARATVRHQANAIQRGFLPSFITRHRGQR